MLWLLAKPPGTSGGPQLPCQTCIDDIMMSIDAGQQPHGSLGGLLSDRSLVLTEALLHIFKIMPNFLIQA